MVFLVKKAQQQYSNQGQNYNQKEQQKEGDVKITYKPNDDKKHVKGGDYVEFEEVD